MVGPLVEIGRSCQLPGEVRQRRAMMAMQGQHCLPTL